MAASGRDPVTNLVAVLAAKFPHKKPPTTTLLSPGLGLSGNWMASAVPKVLTKIGSPLASYIILGGRSLQ